MDPTRAWVPNDRAAACKLDKAVQKLAKAIIADQQIEIDNMKQWRKDWYGK